MAEFDYTQDITVVSREDGSGTRGAFIELLGVEKEDENGEKVDYTTEEAVITNSTNVMSDHRRRAMRPPSATPAWAP